MSEPIRVLHIFGALDSGGVANFVMNVYRAIDREKVQFDFALSSGERSLMDDEAQELGARIYYFDKNRSLTDNLKEILKTGGPFAVVHSHMFFYSGLLLRTAKRHGVPVRIAHAHNAYTGESRSLPRRGYEAAMRFLIRRYATAMPGCSEKACRYVFGEGRMCDPRVSVLPDGIDCARFAFSTEAAEHMRRELGLKDSFVVGHVGHFNPAKNHEKILGVFAALVKRRETSALLLVGDGELEDSVRRRAAELGIADKVVFAGPRRDVDNMYQAMDVFLFPSRYEGFGMAIIEAQANGLYCVASDEVPKAADAADRAVFLPLDASDDEWAETVLNADARCTDSAPNEKVKETYDIRSVTGTLCGMYLTEKE